MVYFEIQFFVTCWRTTVYSLLWSYILCLHFWIVFIMTRISWNPGSQYWGSVPYILLLFWPGWRKLFVVPRTLLYRGSLNRGSTVTRLLIGGLNCTVLYCNFQLLTTVMDLHGWLGAVKEPIEFDNIQPQNDHVVLILVFDLSSHHVWSRVGLKKL